MRPVLLHRCHRQHDDGAGLRLLAQVGGGQLFHITDCGISTSPLRRYSIDWRLGWAAKDTFAMNSS
jgi:hypothetical protein